jgi:hypothetical protein
MIPTAKQIIARRKPDKIPPGWHTRQEIQKAWGFSRDYTGRLLNESIEDGRCETKKFTVLTKARGLYPTPHYKFNGKA